MGTTQSPPPQKMQYAVIQQRLLSKKWLRFENGSDPSPWSPQSRYHPHSAAQEQTKCSLKSHYLLCWHLEEKTWHWSRWIFLCLSMLVTASVRRQAEIGIVTFIVTAFFDKVKVNKMNHTKVTFCKTSGTTNSNKLLHCTSSLKNNVCYNFLNRSSQD